MTDLPKLLRIKAGVIEMGERIAWGSGEVVELVTIKPKGDEA